MSSSVAGTAAPPREAEAAAANDRVRRFIAAGAGPALIVAGVLFTLRGFAFHALLTNHHPDILAFWLPRYSFLGNSLADGHLPLWNPYDMLGHRFAADPQSGFLYAPAMLLFSSLPAGQAMRALIVLNPILAGLGLYWFLRRESLSRLAATTGGLSLAMLMSTSEVAISMPFAGFIAWTTIVLVAASGYRRADRWSRRIAWVGLAAFAWSQVANAHMSHGLAMCSLLVVAYLATHSIASVHAGERAWDAAARGAIFLVALPLASLAVLLPRLAFIDASSLHAGYASLGEPLGNLTAASRPITTNGVWAAWPLGFGVAPGAYAGATILLGVPLALRARAHRAVVWAFGGALAVVYVLLLNIVVTAGWFRALLLRIPFGDVYLHNPGRLRYLAMIAIPILGAVGIQGLLDEPLPARRAARWLGAGVALFLLVPLAAGGRPVRFLVLAIALCAAVPAVYALATRRGRRGPLLVCVVLAIELFASAIYSGLYEGGTIFTGLESGDHPNLAPQVLRYPDVAADAFLRPTPLVEELRRHPNARYLTWAPPAAYFEKGYLFTQRPGDWPALALERGTLFQVPDALGYNPVQLPRYWTYIRATNDLFIVYNASVIAEPSLEDVRLMGVRYLVVPKGQRPVLPWRVVKTADDYRLVEVYGWEPRVSVVPAWTLVDDPAAALHGVLEPGFDPARSAYLEHDPGIEPEAGAEPGSATYREATPEEIRISVSARAPSIVVVRNSYDPGWSATVDGRPAPVLPTDSFLQGVAVPAGRHEVLLSYRDEAIGLGLLLSTAAWLVIGLAFAVAVWVDRRRLRPGTGGVARGP